MSYTSLYTSNQIYQIILHRSSNFRLKIYANFSNENYVIRIKAPALVELELTTFCTLSIQRLITELQRY
jgi:hypothetical protein